MKFFFDIIQKGSFQVVLDNGLVIGIPAEYVEIFPGTPEARVRVDIKATVYSSIDQDNMPDELKPKTIVNQNGNISEIKETPAFSPIKSKKSRSEPLAESINDSVKSAATVAADNETVTTG